MSVTLTPELGGNSLIGCNTRRIVVKLTLACIQCLKDTHLTLQYGCHIGILSLQFCIRRQEIEEQFIQRLCFATGMTVKLASTTFVTGKHKFSAVQTELNKPTSMSGAPKLQKRIEIYLKVASRMTGTSSQVEVATKGGIL